MLLPSEFVWLEPVIIAAIIVFLVDLIGNSIAYGGRVLNALVTAVVFLIIFGALAYFGLGSMQVSTDVVDVPSMSRFLPEDLLWLEPVLIGTLIVLIVGFIGNMLAFKNRFLNALVTAIIFLVIFGAVTYFGYGAVAVDLPVVTSGETVAP